MNVITITAAYNESGGATRVATDLVNELEKQSVEFSVFAGTHDSTRPNVHTIAKAPYRSILSRVCANDMEFFATDYLLTTEAFKRADIVHAHNLHGWYFNLDTLRKMSLEKPVVWTLHDMWAITSHCAHTSLPLHPNGFYTCEQQDTYPRLWWNNRDHLLAVKARVYQGSTFTIVTPSQWLKDKVAPSLLGKQSTRLIYNGIDTDTYRPTPRAEARTALNVPLDKKVVLFVANGGIDNLFKGGDFVRQLASEYQHNQNVLFVCIGGTHDSTEGNIIHKKSIQKKEELARWYAAADVFLFTSRSENFPLVVLEAMACGLPVLSFAVGGVPEAITHQTHGYIARHLDSADLHDGLEYLLTLPHNMYTAMQTACRHTAETKFSLSVMCEQYLSLYRSLL